jgi:hypothetical protein
MVRDCLRCLSVCSGHRVSTFLHPLAPPALPGFIATMSAVTPARGRACGLNSTWHPSPANGHAGLSTSRVLPSELSVSNHPAAPRTALPPTSQRPGHRASSRVWASPLHPTGQARGQAQARQTALPNRVCHSTDCSFASGCSPPRLTADAVTSGYRLVGSPGLDFHLPDMTRLWAHDGRVKPGHDVERQCR